MIEKLADLRAPPVVGRYYLVPVIRWNIWGVLTEWPVLGPLHHDRDVFDFEHVHYHLDGRFLHAREEARITSILHRDFEGAIGGVVLHDNAEYRLTVPRGLPKLQKRLCKRSSYGYAHHDKPAPAKLKELFGEPAEAVRVKGGRLLCPHRKVDLSSFPPDENGLVTCPLHGLRVRCGGQ